MDGRHADCPRGTAVNETALYRYYDKTDRLLYVGITYSLGGRERGHSRSSIWMQLVAGSTVTRYIEREDAIAAERLAVETERPLFNRQYNDTMEARERLKAYLEEIGRMDLHVPWPYARNVPPGEPGIPRAKKKKSPPDTQTVAYLPTDAELEAACREELPELYPIVVAASQDDRLGPAAYFLLAAAISLDMDDIPDDSRLAELKRCGYYRDGKWAYGRPETPPVSAD